LCSTTQLTQCVMIGIKGVPYLPLNI